jgi:hypothetical protein
MPPHRPSKRATSLPLEPSAQTSRIEIAQKVHDILARKRLTLSQVSQASEQLFSGESRYHLSHDLYSDLRTEAFTPSIHQLFALSTISGYRLVDWLKVFGFSFDQIPRLQAAISFPRTTLLTSTIYDTAADISWFEERRSPKHEMRIIPLSQFLEPSGKVPIAALQKLNRRSFLYARVGQLDTLAFPELLPGSIVRVDPSIQGASTERGGYRKFFLVRHAGGLNCCQLQHLSNDRVAMLSTESSHPRIELRLGTEIRIVGAIDMEIRNVSRVKRPDTRQPFRRPSEHMVVVEPAANILRDLLRTGRVRAGLSFREASALSRRVSEELADKRYFAAAGSLSDYEATNAPPRHVQKILTLCTLYSIDFWQFLKAAQLPLERLGVDPILPSHMPHLPKTILPSPSAVQPENPQPGPFFHSLLAQMEEIPFFLRHALPALSGLHSVYLRDLFWAEKGKTDFLPLHEGVQFAIVNRRTKTPAPLKWAPLWKQPLYLLLRRDGSYSCGRFTLKDGKAILQSPHELARTHPSDPGSDAEIVGQITAVVRRLPWPR